MRRFRFAPSVLVALAAVAFVPRLAAADTTIPLSGTVPADGPNHFFLPFEVPPGTREIEIAHDDLSKDNILDWGLQEPDGKFRGWGGGNEENAITGEVAASRSYLAGPLPAGTWRVVVGKAKVVSSPATYQVTVTLRDVAKLPEQNRVPYSPRPPLRLAPAWYAGDFHVHSIESGDARPPIAEVLDFAKARGLDFVELSDHNTNSQLDFYGANARPDILLLPGVEYTTYAGHANGIGATKYVDDKIGQPGVGIEGAVDQFHAQGALFSINHPVLDLGDLCIGCAWKHALPPEKIDAVEIGTGGWRQTGLIFGRNAMAYWDALCATGRHAAAIGGSDDHQAGKSKEYNASPIGSPTTVVFAKELSVQGIVDGVRSGRTVVKLQDPTDPMIELDASGLEGDTVRARGATVRAKVTGAPKGASLVFVTDGVPGDELVVDADPFVRELPLSSPASGEKRVRAEVWIDGAPRTVTSHVWLAFADKGEDPTQRASLGGGCSQGRAPSGGWAAGLAVLPVLLVAARRRRRG
jgi:hypothetical protein